MSKPLTQFRHDFVRKHLQCMPKHIMDVGIGGGAFVEKMDCRGVDINPHAIAWLQARNRFGPAPGADVYGLTFWDSFEHIPNHDGYLKSAELVFMTIPICQGAEDVRRYKHFKPGEHIWHFTALGIVRYMNEYGYSLIDSSDEEVSIGRECVHSFAFAKVSVKKGGYLWP